MLRGVITSNIISCYKSFVIFYWETSSCNTFERHLIALFSSVFTLSRFFIVIQQSSLPNNKQISAVVILV
jgi:Ni,Fe-hydrogenase III small subunit